MSSQSLPRYDAIQAHWGVGYVAVGCTTFLIADYIQTFQDEVKYMWRSNLSVMKILFFFVRYFPFVHTSLTINFYGAEGSPLTKENACEVGFFVFALTGMIIYWMCDAIAYIRAYAFSGRNKRLLIFLILWYIVLRIGEFILFYKFSTTARFLQPLYEARLGCIPAGRPSNTQLMSYMGILIMLSVGSVTGIMVYVSWKRRQEIEGSESGFMSLPSLYDVLLRDGITFFASMCLIILLNIIVDRTARQNGTQYTMVQVYIHANPILTCRMLLQLRSFVDKDPELTESGGMRLRTRGTTNRYNIEDDDGEAMEFENPRRADWVSDFEVCTFADASLDATHDEP